MKAMTTSRNVMSAKVAGSVALTLKSKFFMTRVRASAAVFAFALAVVCGIGFSLAPALRATKADLTPALKEDSALQLPGYGRFGLRNLLMVAQVAGSLMLLLIIGFLVIGFSKTSGVQTKFDPHTIYLLSIDPVRDGSGERQHAGFLCRVANPRPGG